MKKPLTYTVLVYRKGAYRPYSGHLPDNHAAMIADRLTKEGYVVRVTQDKD